MGAEGLIAAVRSLATRFDQRSMRERVLIGVMVVVVISALADLLILGPQRDRVSALAEEIETSSQELSEMRDSRDALAQSLEEDPTIALKETLERLEKRETSLDRQLESAASGLVSARAMTDALRALLADAPLSLVSLKTDPATRFQAQAEASNSSEPAPGEAEGQPAASVANIPRLFRHPITLRFEGRFEQTLAYLQRVQALGWTFHWDEIVVEMETFPRAEVTWRLHTLSLEEGLLGG